MGRFGRLVAVLGGLTALAPGLARSADPLAPVRRFIPPGAKVFFHVQANVDDTPGKEWVIAYELVPPGEYATYPAGYRHLLILRAEDADWRKAFTEDGLSELELRDLDGDRVLEVILWCHDEGYWCFETLDSRGGQFRLLPGLGFGFPACDLQGFIDLEGDGPLELIATGLLPGYLAAMSPDEAARFPKMRYLPGHPDVRFYRLANGCFVLYFPHPSVAVHGLNAGLVSGYRDTRLAAADAAGILRVEACVPRLLDLLVGPDEGLAAGAVRSLGRIGSAAALAGVLRAAQDRREAVVQAAAHALCDIDDPRAVEALLAVRNHDDSEVREAVARKLGKVVHPQGLSTLLQYLKDEDGSVRGAAREALRQHPGPEVGEAVAGLLDDPWPWVRREAAKLLAERGDERGVQALAASEEEWTEPVKRANPWLPDPWLLNELGEDANVERLLERHAEDPALGPHVVSALVTIGGPDAISALRGLREVPDAETKAAATLALVDLGAPDTLELLLQLSRSGNHEAKRRLAEIPGEQVERELVRSLAEDPPPPNANIWGDLYYVDYEREHVPGWFLPTSRRLGERAVPILMSRVERMLPSHLDTDNPPDEGDYAAAVAAAHCLRELGVIEAIPLLQQMSASHPDSDGRDVALWSLVSLRRKAAGITGPLFAEAKP